MAGKKITKSDIIDSVYLNTGMSRKEIRTIADLFLDRIKCSLAEGISIELRGFGTFEVRIRKGRPHARNPRTGASLAVHSHGVAAFKPGRELKQEVWKVGAGDSAKPGEAEPAGANGE